MVLPSPSQNQLLCHVISLPGCSETTSQSKSTLHVLIYDRYFRTKNDARAPVSCDQRWQAGTDLERGWGRSKGSGVGVGVFTHLLQFVCSTSAAVSKRGEGFKQQS